MTARFSIDKDEWYPVYTLEEISDHYNPSWSSVSVAAGELTPDELARINKAFNDFDEVQGFLRDRFHKNGGKR